MEVNTPQDWWDLVTATIPKLHDYAEEMRVPFSVSDATELLNKRDHLTLYAMFNKLWEDLPDKAYIRTGPFFDLCDLCSEYPVMEEQGNGTSAT